MKSDVVILFRQRFKKDNELTYLADLDYFSGHGDFLLLCDWRKNEIN